MNYQNSSFSSTDLSENTVLFDELLEKTTATVKELLQDLANNADFNNVFQTAFGNDIDTELLELLKESWIAGEFVFPEIEIVNRSQINNANGAFARDTNKIYLAQEFLLANINNLDAVSNVLTEEYGHFIDSQFNVIDAPGDEGAIFADLVRGKELSEGELQQLRNEDDSAVVVLGGENIEIEKSEPAIFIESKNVEFGIDSGREHLYLVFRDEFGEEFVIRGGPQNNNPLNFGNITVEANVPIDKSEDKREENGNSVTPSQRNSRKINFEGRDIKEVWNLMVQQAENIGDANLDYNAAINAQNSNSTVASVLNSVGKNIEDNLPINKGKIDFPGIENLLSFSTFLEGGNTNDVIRGNGDSDTLNGGEGNDYINGGNGDDKLQGGGGDDVINGGDGIDTAFFSDNFDNYDFSIINNTSGVTVTHARGIQSDGVDFLNNVRLASFKDKTVPLYFDKGTIKETINFSGNDVGIAGNFLNGKKNTFTLPLIAEIDKSGRFDSFGVKFDYGIDFTVGLEGFLDLGSIGRTDFDYPVNASITLPDDIQPNENFSIDTSFNVDNASISGEGLVLPNAGIDLVFGLGETGFQNITIPNPNPLAIFNRRLKISDILSSSKKTNNYNIFKIDPDGFEFSPIGLTGSLGSEISLPNNYGSVGFYLPDSINLETDDTSKDNNDELIALKANGKETVANLQLDLDEIFAEFPALKPYLDPLGVELDFGDHITVGFDFLDVKSNLGLALQQKIELDPDRVLVTMSLNDTQKKTGNLGEEFNFIAPSTDSGVLEVDVKYELLGELKTDFAIVPESSLNIDALKATFKAKTGFLNLDIDAELKPLLSHKFEENNSNFSKPLLELPTFTTQISPEIEGINTEFTSTYYIPYGDGPEDTEEADIVDNQGEKVGEVALTLPTYMLDGDAEYTVTLSSSGAGIQYNFAYIIDVSGSMDWYGGLTEAKNAYINLTDSLIDSGVADISQFTVIPFASSAYTVGPINSTDTKSTIQGLSADGYTNFNAALTEAKDFFSELPAGATNIAYFLSDGESNRGGDFSNIARDLQSLADVRAYGIGSADIDALNIVDSNSAVFLTNSSDLQTEFASSGFSRNDISQVNIILDNEVVEIIQPDQLQDSPLGLNFSGTLENLSIATDAENRVSAEVIFTDDRPNAKVDFVVTSGSGTGASTDDNDSIRLGATELEADGGNGDDEIVGNYIGNTLSGGNGDDVIFGNDGDDLIIPGTGDDRIDGGEGIDTVEYANITLQDSSVSKVGGVITVDNINNSSSLEVLSLNSVSALAASTNDTNDDTDIDTDNDSSIDTITNVEYIQFADTRISSTTLESIPVLEIADVTITEQNQDSHLVQVTYNLSAATDNEVQFSYATVDDTAIAGLDYKAASGDISIPVGDTSGSLEIEIFGDTEIEPDEIFNLAFSNLSGATFENNDSEFSTIVEIENDDLEASLALLPSDVIQLEENEGLTQYTFNVARIDNIVGETTVDYEIIGSGDNPVDAADFKDSILPSGTITFADGETEKSVQFNVAGDSQIEADEEFSIALSNPSQDAKIITEELKGFVINDDEPIPAIIEVIETETVLSISESDDNKELSFTVSRTGNTEGEVIVSYALEGSSENPVDAADFEEGVLPAGTITFADGETSKKITFNIADDVDAENNEGFILTLDTSSDATQIVTPSLTGTIEDDDSTLQVIDSQVFSDGIVAFYFNQDLNQDILNLYGTDNLPDITIQGEQTGTVNGSLIWNPEFEALGFIKTGKFLQPDTYTATLFSREDGIAKVEGEILDGDTDGNSGGDYQFQFTIEQKSDRIISIPDLTLAPGATTDIPVTLDNVEGITKLEFDFYYDTDLLDIIAINSNDNLPANWGFSESEIDRDNGIVNVTIEGTDALTGDNLNIVNLAATVPDTAGYGETQILDLANVVLNDGNVSAVDDDGIHQVIKAGDTTGDGTLSGLDAYQMMRVSVGLDDGFDNFSTVDPIISADINQDGVISAFDAYRAIK